MSAVAFLEHRIPPPLVGLACGAAMWALAPQAPGIDLSPAMRAALAGPVFLAGLGVMLAGVISFRRARTTVNPLSPESASALVCSGVFRYTRNPMYLGMLLVLVAWAAVLASPPSLLGPLAFWAYIGRFQIRPEEAALGRLFGHAFTDYTRRVRRWL